MNTNYPISGYTVNQIVEMLNVSKVTVYRWISSRRLASIKIGGCVRIAQEDLQVFLKENKREAIC